MNYIRECNIIRSYIYVCDDQYVKHVTVPKLAISDHFPIGMTWKCKTESSKGHKSIKFRDSSTFNKNSFLAILKPYQILKMKTMTILW